MTIVEEQALLARVCSRMTDTGIPLDLDRLKEVRATMTGDKLAVQGKHQFTEANDPAMLEALARFMPAAQLKRLAKGKIESLPINLKSSKQIKGYLEALYGIVVPDTKFETIEKWSEKRPDIGFLGDVAQFKAYGKGDEAWFADKYIGGDSRLHPRWNPTGTSERRLSCSGPNFQNVPHRAKGGDSYFSRLVRSVVVPAPGKLLAEIDASQGEDWAVGFDVWTRTGSREVLDLLEQKIDFHSRTGSYTLGRPVHKCSATEDQEMYLARSRGKQINHSHKYGEGFRWALKGSSDDRRLQSDSEKGLAVLGWTGDEYRVYFGAWRLAQIAFDDTSNNAQRLAIRIKTKLMQDYPGILQWQQRVFEQWRSTGMVRNFFGFSRPLYGEPSDCAKRAYAFLGASTLQTVMIRGMIDVAQEVRDWEQHAQIHDSLLGSTDAPDTIDRIVSILQRPRCAPAALCPGSALTIPFESSFTDQNWSLL